MGTMQPLRSKHDIEELKKYFLDKGQIRNYVLVVLGINLPLRISDILALRWRDVYNMRTGHYLSHLQVVEQKTGKRTFLAINHSVCQALQMLMDTTTVEDYELYIFRRSSNSRQHLSRVTAYLTIRNAAEDLGFLNIGCHSLRKTFGYHAWKQGVHLALIMSIYNHSSINITKRYLGIEQEDKDDVLLKMNL